MLPWTVCGPLTPTGVLPWTVCGPLAPTGVLPRTGCGPLTPTGVLFWTVYVVPWLPQGCCFGLFMWSLDSHRGAALDCLCGLLTPTGVLFWTVYVIPWLSQGCCSGLCLCGLLTPTGVRFWTLFMWSPSVITYVVDCDQAALCLPTLFPPALHKVVYTNDCTGTDTTPVIKLMILQQKISLTQILFILLNLKGCRNKSGLI